MLDRLHRPAADVDTYVIESVGHLRRLGVDPVDFAERHTLLLLKPDAIVARSVEPTLDWLAEAGYRVAHAERITADRHLARAMWRTSWITASAERRRLADLLVGVCDALVLVIADAADDAHADAGAEAGVAEPVSVRLTRAKGATDPRRRAPGELRHALGVHSHLLNLVHTPDDPFDVLRELAIVFDERTRERVLAGITAGGEPTAPVPSHPGSTPAPRTAASTGRRRTVGSWRTRRRPVWPHRRTPGTRTRMRRPCCTACGTRAWPPIPGRSSSWARTYSR
ncbi:nucleoside-diphosphate kinase [Tsukamurella sp. PLM1]|uniref:nucleoside-diphosphate kinase n=1 Tax=Tsukamurella sp. PLM1 TaxID=2929795 RepID=UPI002054ED06|nr:nucleoside-diphosphate kinase [Tsukamurella sp. PLM1]BDH56031.1 hypothetical protein MTP03_09700 [Tsukamurella sp. PLM1]